MTRGVRQRLVSAAASVAAALAVCFALGQLTPGDAFSALELDPSVSPAALAHLRAEYAPQASLAGRFASWLAAAAHGDLGISLASHRPVLSLLRQRAPASAELLALGLGMAWITGLALALLPAWLGECARWRMQRALAAVFGGAAALLTALPLGVLAVGALLLAPAAWLPGGTGGSPWLPAAVLALAFLPMVYFQAHQALAAAERGFLAQERAAGIGPWRRVLAHALPNTSDTLAPVASLSVSQALAELVILEPLLGWPGLGQLSLQAAESKDMPVLAALVLLTSLVVVACNLASDAAQWLLNPQLRRRTGFAAGKEAAAAGARR